MKSSLISALRTYFFDGASVSDVRQGIAGLTAQDKVDLAAGLQRAGVLTEAGLAKTLAENDAVPHPSYVAG